MTNYKCGCVHTTIYCEGGGMGGSHSDRWTYCQSHKNIFDQIETFINDANKQKETLLSEIKAQSFNNTTRTSY